jgi:hypothetical protein
MKKKQQYWTVNASGEVVKTWDVLGLVPAATKAEAQKALLQFAKRALEERPRIKIENGAVQVAFHDLRAVTVTAGTFARPEICSSSAPTMDTVTRDCASFAYYASAEYQARQ